MKHNMIINNQKVTVDFSCSHSEIKNNTCPTRIGNCGSCEYCVATLSALDMFAIIKNQKED